MKNERFGQPLKNNDFKNEPKRLIEIYNTSFSESSKVRVSAARGLIDAMRLWIIYFGERKVERLLNFPRKDEKYFALIQKKDLRALRELPTNSEYIKGLGDERCYFEIELLRARIAYQRGYNFRCYQILDALNDRWESLPEKERLTLAKKNLLMTRINLVAGKAMNQDRDHALARVHFGMAYHHGGELGKELKNHYSHGRIQTVFARSFLEYKISGSIINYLDKAAESYDEYFGIRALTERNQLFYSEVYEIKARNKMITGDSEEKVPLNQKGNKANRSNWEKEALQELRKARLVTNSVLKKRKNHRRKAHQRYIHGRIELTGALRLLNKNGNRFSASVLTRLKKAEWAFTREVRLRRCYFKHQPHPSLAKAYNFLCKVHLLRAEAFALELKPTLESGKPDIVAKLAKQHLEKAEQCRRLASKSNKKDLVTPEKDTIQTTLLEGVENVNEKLRGVISDYQAFRSESRKLECQHFRYCFSELTSNSKVKVFRKLMATYVRCETLLAENIKWFAFSESQEDLRKKFLGLQRIALNTCNRHIGLFPEKEELVYRSVYRVLKHDPITSDVLQANATMPPTRIELIGIKGMMNAIQTANLYRLKQKDLNATDSVNVDDPSRKRFEKYASAIFRHHKDRIQAVDRINKVKKPKDSGPEKYLNRRRRKAYRLYERRRRSGKVDPNPGFESLWRSYLEKNDRGKYEEFRKANNDPRSRRPDDILKRFDKGTSRGLAAYFIDNQELYVFGLFSNKEGKGSVKFKRLTAPTTFAASELLDAIEELRKRTKQITSLVGQTLNKSTATKNNKLLLLRDSFLTGTGSMDKELETKLNLPTTSLTQAEADQINHCYLNLAYRIQEMLFPKDFLPDDLEALYYVPSGKSLSLLPIGLLPTIKISEKQGICYRYDQQGFLGAKYQIAYMPSVAHLYALGEKSETPAKTNKKKAKLNDQQLQEWLKKKKRLILLAVSPTSDNINDDSARVGLLTLYEIRKALTNRFTRFDKTNVAFYHKKSEISKGMDRKKRIIDESLRSIIVYFFGHVGQVGRENGPNKMLIHNDKSPVKIDPHRPWHEAMKKDDGSIYNEEISDENHRENYLFFLNGCEAAVGEERSGLLPFSLVASCLEAGAKAVIGTNTLVDVEVARTFCTLFFNFWLDDKEEGMTTIGQSIRKTIQVMLSAGKDGSYNEGTKSHPLNWGGYLLMGNLNLQFTKILEEISSNGSAT